MANKSSPRLIGDYEIVGRPLGSGGMASVYLVTKNGKKFAAKILHKHLMQDKKTVARFKKEFDIGRSMKDNQAFLAMYELTKFDGCWTIIMEFVPGFTIQEIVSKLIRLSTEETVAIIYEICKALEPFHLKNFVHRDLKPGNLMITPQGQLKIMDYGITRDLGSNITKTGTAVGTPIYMAPEQICGAKNTDCRCDIYSIGLIMYRLLTQKDAQGLTRNFELVELIETRMKVPIKPIKDFKDKVILSILEKSLSPEPSDRFIDTNVLCQKLEESKSFKQNRKAILKKLVANIEENQQKKPKKINIEKTLIHKTKPKNNFKLLIFSGIAAILAGVFALSVMGQEKFVKDIKSFLSNIFKSEEKK